MCYFTYHAIWSILSGCVEEAQKIHWRYSNGERVPRCLFKWVIGLGPHRELDFSIEFYPSTDPILIAPYRTKLFELKELKTQ